MIFNLSIPTCENCGKEMSSRRNRFCDLCIAEAAAKLLPKADDQNRLDQLIEQQGD